MLTVSAIGFIRLEIDKLQDPAFGLFSIDSTHSISQDGGLYERGY